MAANQSPETLIPVAQQSSRTCYAETNVSCTMCQYNILSDTLNQSFNITLKVSSPAASSGPFCRICHEGDLQEDLLSVCKCTGSAGLVHLRCVERWLSTRRSGHDTCEICNFVFKTIRSPKPFSEWYKSDDNHKKDIFGDVACFFLITPLAVMSAILCLQAAEKHVVSNNSLEAFSLVALATFLLSIYMVWNILTLRFHFKSYLKWSSINQNVKLVGFQRKSPEDNAPSINGIQNTENRISNSFSTSQQDSLSDFQAT